MLVATDSDTKVERLEDCPDEGSWDRYVLAHPSSTFFHLEAWRRILQEAYGFQPIYLVASRAGKVVGVLPLFHCDSLLRGRSLASLPFHFGGGPLGDDQKTESRLVEEAVALTEASGCNDLRLKSYRKLQALHVSSEYLSFRVPLGEDYDAQIRSLSKNFRRYVHVGRRDNQIELVRDLRGLEAFYELFVRCNRDIGIPSHRFSLFDAVWREFSASGAVRITLARQGDRYIAGHFGLVHRDRIWWMWGTGDIRFRNKYAMQALQSESIEWAIGQKLSYYDLGWSHPKSDGSVSYKRRFNGEEEPVYFHSLDKGGGLDYHQSYGLVKAVWKRLPLPVVKLMNDVVSRQVG